ncbi:MAG: RHS repeat-associated core domain-containing protein [Anaerolineales bacterium]|nr:RHS repeat-associated core domain-containing protein [Anaerolineales bacterium]
MRVAGSTNPGENGLYYTIGDHLGSTSLIADSDGEKVDEIRYMPWGEKRYEGSYAPSSYSYTGQREEAGIGLPAPPVHEAPVICPGREWAGYYYNARWYDAELGRFAQADTVIPSLLNPQSFDRYAYVYNNSLKMIDPSGNKPLECEFEAVGNRCSGRSLDDPVPEHGHGSKKPESPRAKAVRWVVGNAEGNDCAAGEDNDCACIVAQALNASGGHTKIDPTTDAFKGPMI